MAVLTQSDYRELRLALYASGLGKEELKALPNLPQKAQFIAAFQGLEDTITSAFPSMKNQMETNLGMAIPNALAKKLLTAWLKWRIKQ